jgi:hypothetical protein
MRRETASRVSWTLLVVCVVTLGLGVWLHALARTSDLAVTPYTAVIIASLLVFPIVGALIVSRHPGHPIGWIFLAAGLANAALSFLSGYGTYSLEVDPPRLPAGTVASWLSDVVWLPSVAASTTFLFLLFPDGKLPSRRWRAVAWAALVGTSMVALSIMFERTLYGFPEIEAPLALSSRADPILAFLGTVGFFLWAAATIAAVISLFVRFRRARGEERLQIKWVAFAAAISLVMVPSFILETSEALAVLEPVALMAIPISVGIAILRYRLYDIDRIINRTLVYGALTALLIGVYVGAAVGLGALARSVSGQENNSFVIAASTLAVAALFGPARRSIQGFIDRRFYRSKYDAARTLDAFNARLREHVDLESLKGELLEVVQETMQPAHASVWLREAHR